MVEINLTIVIQVVQFLILILILNRLLFKPISQVTAERQKKIAAWEVKTRTLQESVRVKLESYEQHLREARAGAQEKQERMNKEVKQEEEERLRALSEEAAQMVASKKQTLQKDIERLRSELRQEASEMSRILVEKVLGRKVA